MFRTNALRPVATVLSVMGVVGLLSRPAAADSLSVESAHPNTAAGQLVIDGSGFRPGLYVSVNDVELKVLSVNAHEIRVALPSLAAGNYRLVVRQWGDDVARFIVTIASGSGSASQPGSQGVQGPVGPAGATGPAGPVGPAGPAGRTGPTGPAGLQGLQGIQGPSGPDGSQGIQGLKGDQGPAGPAGLTVVAHNGQTLGTLVAVTKAYGSDPAIVARQDNGFWLAIPVDSSGVVAMSYPIFYTGVGCTGDAFAYAEASPTPLFRLLQRMLPDETTGYYAGDPVQMTAFPSMLGPTPGDSTTKTCATTMSQGWSGAQLTGPLQAVDLSVFPAPFTIQ